MDKKADTPSSTTPQQPSAASPEPTQPSSQPSASPETIPSMPPSLPAQQSSAPQTSTTPTPPPQTVSGTTQPPMKVPQSPKANKKLLGIMGGAMVVLMAIVAGIFFFVLGEDTGEEATISSQEEIKPVEVQNQSLEEQAESVQVEDVEDTIQQIERELENL